ncbi:uncharacterized protein BP5553_09328 [Venustampulla echinocandica]|uniref:alpha-1,2-Mannosidase n=1 Tax=Venustampulla echinocandica TaxID=2656787 RepID=A0A370TCH1_9HELO|nr:uncharacterized protein BP5553_09328 [Venustampulla echinocandica]RDL31926.1 hypothetical protein BP5553_09328 [Venustampulla echinocandica]
MLRFRRYRVFLVAAAVIIFLFVRLRHQDGWSEATPLKDLGSAPQQKGEGDGDSSPDKAAADAKFLQPASQPSTKRQQLPLGPTKTKGAPASAAVASKTKFGSKSTVASTTAPPPTIPNIGIPDRKLPPARIYVDDDGMDDVHPVAPPGRQEAPSFTAETTIHWEKQVQHFPVPTESIIQLPTGKPLAINKIQHSFSDETHDAKTKREARQARVKEEFQKAWAGYKKYAWLHDELSPVSGKFRDPFCGWAATLVDSLDTLWIMGLEEEFEEAVRAVDLIDFTTSSRNEIPVFETTIRYLGGLLAAYDVSGGRFKNLLGKAVELAEILIGAFDTPNRMPVLYYNWKPAYASQPHRASSRSNLAELGSLSMEFTRLAQLTHNTKYYDAVARVTDALSEWQDRGTPLDGVFPENVDASGCNRTARFVNQQPIAPPVVVPDKDAEEVLGYQPAIPGVVQEPKPKKKPTKDSSGGPGTLQFQITPGEPAKGQVLGWEDTHPNQEKKSSKRDMGNESTVADTTPTPTRGQGIVDRQAAEDDCVPQGLTSAGYDKFSMGGGQDSTYEYFPKQYLLLGGLEDKYRPLYMKTIQAVRKWMLYRPMVPGNRDILFSGLVTNRGSSEDDLVLSAEVEHLTCFIGGMVGMAAKIFDLEGDLELAKRLTDGCVWAYNSTPSGIMPEGGIVFPCESAEHCTWNETAYHRALDPYADSRAQDVAQYIANKKAVEEEERDREAEAARVAAEEKPGLSEAEAPHNQSSSRELSPDAHLGKKSSDLAANTNGANSLRNSDRASLQKREIVSSSKGKTSGPNDESLSSVELSPSERLYNQKSETAKAGLQDVSGKGRNADLPLQETKGKTLRDPLMPYTHEGYVKNMIEQNGLPEGYVSIRDKRYILRPEAIESVWYMYRITGDSSWQDKGWKMFKSVIDATSVEHGHSAIVDVTTSNSTKADEMESFWLSETLKYYYLLYSTPDTISLDEWVLNTEAHPFKRPS